MLHGIKDRLTLSRGNEYLNQNLPSAVFLLYLGSSAKWRRGLPDSFLFPLLFSVHFIFSEEKTSSEARAVISAERLLKIDANERVLLIFQHCALQLEGVFLDFTFCSCLFS